MSQCLDSGGDPAAAIPPEPFHGFLSAFTFRPVVPGRQVWVATLAASPDGNRPAAYISVIKWRRSGFLEFTKLLLALSSFAQSFDQMKSIQEHYFIILNHRQACAGRSRVETAGKTRGPVTKWPPRRLLFPRLEIVFVIISSFTKRTKVVHE